ncbi:hypothetical protein P4O66_002742 [Electrophorus voltai]|uniref:Uncharacterized protein n=1 Tax=Electrophorus voltai TaxID=2609070 RepID=A0AAD9DNM5_9TELE|nr:hypothetical protein P4O66_002742 [Electrophorus voltai]
MHRVAFRRCPRGKQESVTRKAHRMRAVVMEIRGFAVGLLLALSATLLVDAQPADVRSRYIHFLTQHVYGGMNTNKCSKVIGQRHITEGNTNNCKEINTFILATHEQVTLYNGTAGYDFTFVFFFRPYNLLSVAQDTGVPSFVNGFRGFLL